MLTKEAAKALEKSIAHWKQNLECVEAETFAGFALSGADCALCETYRKNSTCGQCPVALKTGRENCCSTPWEEVFVAAYTAKHQPGKKDFAPVIAAVRAELEFLESLRETSC
ncbi:MAG: hypothetical protein ACRDAJ_06860 [Serratia fonticola]